MLSRYFMSIKRCLYIFVVSIFFCFGLITDSFAEEFEEQLYSKSAVLIDGKTGRILYEKNAYEPLPMASTTKIMTCIIALENASLNKTITVSSYAASMPQVHLGMKEGEKYYLEDLLYSLMLESHNDTAVAVAEGVSGNVESFLELMNKKAKEIGCSDTLFLTPNGLDKTIIDENKVANIHHSTAYDMALIMSYCINESPKCKEFLEITRTNSYTFTDLDSRRTFTCNNHNSFLSMMEGALTGKTGFTNDAGYCYVGALRDDDRDYIVALLGCGWPNNKSYKWSDTKKLMKYGVNGYSNKNIPLPICNVTIDVSNGQYDINRSNCSRVVGRYLYENIQILLCEHDNITFSIETEKVIDAPVEKGQILGKIKGYVNNYLVYEGDIIATCSVAKKHYWWALEQLIKLALYK